MVTNTSPSLPTTLSSDGTTRLSFTLSESGYEYTDGDWGKSIGRIFIDGVGWEDLIMMGKNSSNYAFGTTTNELLSWGYRAEGGYVELPFNTSQTIRAIDVYSEPQT